MPGPGAMLNYAGDDVNEYKKAFEPKTNPPTKNTTNSSSCFEPSN